MFLAIVKMFPVDIILTFYYIFALYRKVLHLFEDAKQNSQSYLCSLMKLLQGIFI